MWRKNSKGHNLVVEREQRIGVRKVVEEDQGRGGVMYCRFIRKRETVLPFH